MPENGVNWKMVMAVTAAVIGVAAAAALYIKKMRATGVHPTEALDEMLDFVRSKTNELDRLIAETS